MMRSVLLANDTPKEMPPCGTQCCLGASAGRSLRGLLPVSTRPCPTFDLGHLRLQLNGLSNQQSSAAKALCSPHWILLA